MAKRGPNGTSNIIKMAKGTVQPCRSKEDIHKSGRTNADLVCPDWLGELAKELWSEKIDIYNASGIDVSNHGPALAQYCALEAEIIMQYKARNIWVPTGDELEPKGPSVSMISAHRIWAAEFFDTPASGHLKTKSGNKGEDPWENL